MLRRIESWPDWKLALWLAVAGRILYSALAAILAPFLHPDPALIHSNALTENLPSPQGLHYALLGIWERFDTLWYLHIAAHGYDQPHAVIFYPVYPAAIRVSSWIMPQTAAALAVSTVAAFFFFCGLLRLAATDLSQSGRLKMLLVLAAWPTSFVLFAGYAESITLALIVWAVAFARRGAWWLATACGLLAGMARPSGVLVAIPLALMALRSRRLSGLIVLLSPAGLLAYWGWLRVSGRPSVVEAYRVYQGSALAPPWAGLIDAVRQMMTRQDGLLAIQLALVVLVAALSTQRGVRLEDKVFALAVIAQLLMYTGRPLLGATRYLLPVYPAFLVLGGYVDRRWNWKQLGFCLGAFGFLNLVWFWAFLNWNLVF